jgi:hypothetical protein
MFVVAGCLVDASEGRRIRRSSYDAIQIGMTDAEVEELIGPPGDYFSGPPGKNYRPEWGWQGPRVGEGDMSAVSSEDRWNGDNGGIIVRYDDHRRVVQKTFFESTHKARWYRWVLWDWGWLF